MPKIFPYPFFIHQKGEICIFMTLCILAIATWLRLTKAHGFCMLKFAILFGTKYSQTKSLLCFYTWLFYQYKVFEKFHAIPALKLHLLYLFLLTLPAFRVLGITLHNVICHGESWGDFVFKYIAYEIIQNLLSVWDVIGKEKVLKKFCQISFYCSKKCPLLKKNWTHCDIWNFLEKVWLPRLFRCSTEIWFTAIKYFLRWKKRSPFDILKKNST